MNEVQILAASMQQLVMNAVANYRVKPFGDRDVHAYLLFVYGMKLLNLGFQEDGLKLVVASTNSQNMGGRLVIEAMAKETRRKDLENAYTKLYAQEVGYKLETSELNKLQLQFSEMTMDLNALPALVKKNLHADLPENPKKAENYKEHFEHRFESGKYLVAKAQSMEWGGYKPWSKDGLSAGKVYVAALQLLLASVYKDNKEGLDIVKRLHKRGKFAELQDLIKLGKLPELQAFLDSDMLTGNVEPMKTEETEMKEAYDLSRFLKAQELDYDIALMEIQDGSKESHWIWYIFPQLKGLGHSFNSQYYGLKDRGEAIAYLNHPVLGARLREISNALLQHRKKSIYYIMGSSIDVLKLKTCMQLFDSISPNDVFDKVLDAFFMNEI